MASLKIKQRLLKYVQQDNVRSFLDLMFFYHENLTFMINGTTLLHEVRSIEMLYHLVAYGVDIRNKNQEGKSVSHLLKKRLKKLQKQNLQIGQKKIDNQFEIKRLREVLKLFRLINKHIHFHAELKRLTGGDKYGWILKKTVRFSKEVKSAENFYVDLAQCLAKKAFHTILHEDRVIDWLKKGGFNPKKITYLKHLLQGNEQVRDMYLKGKNSEPLLCYRGTTNQNDSFEPLSHFGTLKAATDRLKVLDKAKDDEMSSFYVRVVEKGHPLAFQIRPAYLKIKNPFRIIELGMHNLERYRTLMVHVLLLWQKGSFFINRLYSGFYWDSPQTAFATKLSKVKLSKEYDFIFNQPYMLTPNQVKKELFLGGFYDVLFEKRHSNAHQINLEHLVFQRMMRMFEKNGYDGFVYKNGWEDAGEDSYITFRKEQVVLATKIDKKSLISRVKNPHEPALLRLENAYLSGCKELNLSFYEAKNMYYFPFVKEFGIKLIPIQIEKAINQSVERIVYRLFNKEWFQKQR